MSCHYSCNGCSASTYLYNCINCPTTRQLIGTLCLCKDGFIEAQAQQCTNQGTDALENVFTTLRGFLDVVYFINIGLFWLYLIIIMCRVNLPKIKAIILFSQLGSLVLYFPYYQQQITQSALKGLAALNFDYFTTLFSCTKSGMPGVCTGFENLIGPALTIPCFLSVLLISYVLMNACYREKLEAPISLEVYFKKTWFMLLFNFVDLTAIYWSLSITRAIITTYWGLFFAGLFLCLLGYVFIHYYRTLNVSEQTTHLYRIKNNWAYIYDEKYHLYYIDFLYDQKKQEEDDEQKLIRQNSNMIRPFVPHSNFVILEILFKLLIASLTVILYQHKPALFGLSVGSLFFIGILCFGAFQNYDRWNLLVYFICFLVFMGLWSLFWTDFFWAIAISAIFVVLLSIAIHFGVLLAVNLKMDEQSINKVYEIDQQKQDQKDNEYLKNPNKRAKELSDEQLLSQNMKNSTINDQTHDNLIKPSTEQQFPSQNITKYSRPSIIRVDDEVGLIGNNKRTPKSQTHTGLVSVKQTVNVENKNASDRNIFEVQSYGKTLTKHTSKNVLKPAYSLKQIAEQNPKEEDKFPL